MRRQEKEKPSPRFKAIWKALFGVLGSSQTSQDKAT